jgi:hypothetical protein
VTTAPPTQAEIPEDWLAFRDELSKSVVRQQNVYDEAVLKLAAAGLGLTVTLARVKSGEDRRPLLAAAVLLAASLGAVLASFITSQVESRKRIVLINEQKLAEASGRQATWMTWLLNYASGALLALAGVALAIFVWLNI